MKRKNRTPIIAVLLVSFFLSITLSSTLESQERAQRDIVSIEVRNNKAISDETILSKIMSKPGAVFSQEMLSEDLKRLYATDYFTDVAIEVEDVRGGVKVILVVEEKPIIDTIIFDGNEAISSHRLRSAMKSKVGDVLSYSLLAQDMNAIKKLYSHTRLGSGDRYFPCGGGNCLSGGDNRLPGISKVCCRE